MNVSAVLVTRGNVDMQPVVDSLPDEWEKVIYVNHGGYDAPAGTCHRIPAGRRFVWNPNECGSLPDLSVYGRYAAIQYAKGDVIFVQDDDCIVPAQKIVDAYEPGRLVANMPEGRWQGYPDSVMVGWGAVFDRNLPNEAFALMVGGEDLEPPVFTWGWGEVFQRTCDIVFSMLTPRTVIDIGFQHLPWAEGPGRMFTTDNTRHNEERNRMIELCRQIRTWPDDDRRE